MYYSRETGKYANYNKQIDSPMQCDERHMHEWWPTQTLTRIPGHLKKQET